MAINKQRWYPDTCGCIVIQAYDTVTKIISFDSYEAVCPQHATLADDTSRYNAMHGDNVRKNQLYGAALSQFSAIIGETDPESGSLVLKKGIRFNWSFSGNGDTRVMTISFSGVTLTTQQKTTLQNLADTNFGSGKVIVQ